MQICPRCQRVNPREAVFCFFDGVALRQGGGTTAAAQLPQEFVFPSGRRCRTFDDFVQGCQYEWEDARHLLHNGDFARFFAQFGRHDLARTAGENQNQADADIALHSFLGQLPAQVQGPRLDLNPRRLLLGGVHAGEQRRIPLTVANQGKGLLQGKVTVTEGGQWLKIAEGNNPVEATVKTARAQTVHLHVDARGLTAAQTYVAKLTVISNGGIAEVAVRLDVVAAPFAQAPFQGAASPRQMAERMRSHPKQAVPLLENGDIARWFKSNGWAYPVSGQPAKGVAAVQQFFECMGLSKPPPLQLSESEFQFACTPPQMLSARIMLRTHSKKWIYAQADSDAPWLRVPTPNVSGPQHAQIAFVVDSTRLDAGAHQGIIHIIANAGQKMAVRVRVHCHRPHQPLARRLVRPFLVGAVLALLLRLLLAGPADLYARGWGQSAGNGEAALAPWLDTGDSANHFLKLFVQALWWLGIVPGAALVWRRGGRLSDVFCGGIASAFAGVLLSATLGCLLLLFDAVPRALLTHWTRPGVFSAAPWLGMLIWMLLSSLNWAVLGGGVGFLLAALGHSGRRLLAAAAAPLAWLFQSCGLERMASYFLLQG